MSIDLHTHSNFSDGTMTPTELVALARHKKLSALALTDHDTMAGIEEAVLAGAQMGVEVVPGIEISVNHAQVEYHILGYWADASHSVLASALSRLQGARAERNEKILEKLKGLGIPVTAEELQVVSEQGQTGRPHIARILVERGVVKTMREAFDQFLKKGEVAYASRFSYDAAEAVALIRQAGGLTVLAHPAQNDPELTRLPAVLAALVPAGLDGIELYYPTHSHKIKKKLRELADQHDLLLTGGSDYHGEVRPGTSLAGGKNIFVPPELLEKMKERLRLRT
ncbi:MAG: PHP domain-containing protein [Desulfoarculaceae bacterium]|nr:PHP domain-containing protein [Desulfoarculaceae bacterium]